MPRNALQRIAFTLTSIFSAVAVESAINVARADKIVFIGNSITEHGPDASIEWSGNWGMAASRADLGYASRVTMLLRQSLHTHLNAAIVSDYPLEHEFFLLSPRLVDTLISTVPAASIVILQFGDNIDLADARSSGTGFGDQYEVVLSRLRAHFGPASRLVCIGKWWPSAMVDSQIAAKCTAAGGSFVPISDIHAESWGPASSERRFSSSGVGEHPGDRAMSEIADRVASSITH